MDSVKENEQIREEVYKKAEALMESGKASDVAIACKGFESLQEWRDADQKAKRCREMLLAFESEKKNTAEVKKHKCKKVFLSVSVFSVLALAAVMIGIFVLKPLFNYNKAVTAADSGDYDTASLLFRKYPDYKDTSLQMEKLKK